MRRDLESPTYTLVYEEPHITVRQATQRTGRRSRGLLPDRNVTLTATDPVGTSTVGVLQRDDSNHGLTQAIPGSKVARFTIAVGSKPAPYYDADLDELPLPSRELWAQFDPSTRSEKE